jgi:hypothetical protein
VSQTLSGLARPFGPDGNWTGVGENKKKNEPVTDSAKLIFGPKVFWASELFFKFKSRFSV